jgi:pilus assembly protein CpaF
MRPDRIVIGEVRGSETLDLLQAMNTGHDGSLSTVHANSPRDALSRLETLSLMAGTELPLRAVREQIAASVQLIVHQARGRDGTRRITHVTELHGMAADIIALQDVFRADVHSGAAQPTGLRPRVLELIEERGFAPPKLWG